MQAVVAHEHSLPLDERGLVCASAALALVRGGYKVVISSVSKFDPSPYAEAFGIDLSGIRSFVADRWIRALGPLRSLFIWSPTIRALRASGAGLLFIDEPMYRPVAKAFRSLNIIEYVNLIAETSAGGGPGEASKGGCLRWPLSRPCAWVYKKASSIYMRENPFSYATAVLISSRWAAKIAKQVYGEEPVVLNPPLPPVIEIKESTIPFDERDDLIVMLGSFNESRRYEWVIGELGPWLKRSGVKLVIFGWASTPAQRAYMKKAISKGRGVAIAVTESGDVIHALSSKDVVVAPNAPRELINSVMDRAKAFLHATINEHWGIAVAEAMARGLPVVVHKSGGAWSDLAEEGRSGLGYEDALEAEEAVLKVIGDRRLWNNLSYASKKRAQSLTLNTFSEGLLELARPL